ncbi:Uncharacterised protein [Serratia fonticola]|uniref:Fimbrial protein n=1 Tax=Serratia fonticola TaxID=47917 RepID=A0A4U9WHS4_SERFO|nr:hypothetical protein [Serratia fonticola]CAI1629573.1 Uncharacterised protein [Serratia fonticola]VTR58935.1 Uncharacterised protein [Serratia fonticola]
MRKPKKVKITANMPGHTQYHRHCALGILLIASLSQPVAQAETITIGKGTGILWEGLPFNVTLSGPLDATAIFPQFTPLAISSNRTECLKTDTLTTIAGYPAVKLTPNVGLIPRAFGNASFYRYYGSYATASGTLGLPESKGMSQDYVVTPPDNYSWCLALYRGYVALYYDKDKMRTTTISGTWVLVADGQQKSAEIKVPEMYAGSFSAKASGDRSASILPSNIQLRISTLECTVNTPTSITFSKVMKNLQAGAELAIQSYPLITSCGQSSDFIDANINLQFRPLTGLYQSVPSRLALREGGGYITGEIDNGVTGSGSCSATSGLPFDNSQLKIGRISKTETSLNTTHQVTWRLCSGGKDLPLGDVSAAAEMLVTFN